MAGGWDKNDWEKHNEFRTTMHYGGEEKVSGQFDYWVREYSSEWRHTRWVQSNVW